MKTQTETLTTIRYVVANKAKAGPTEYVAAIMGTDLVQITATIENALKLDDKIQANVIKEIARSHYDKRTVYWNDKDKPNLVILKVITSVELDD